MKKFFHWWLWKALWEVILYPIVEHQQRRHIGSFIYNVYGFSSSIYRKCNEAVGKAENLFFFCPLNRSPNQDFKQVIEEK
jgi:hypothetical protein